MVNIKENLKNINLIDIKLNVPQVGSFKIDYDKFSDVPNDKIFDFVINLDGDILIGRGHYKLNKKQKLLYFAGRLKIRNGKIIYIDNDSGHYIPTKKETERIKEVLQKSKVAINI